MVRESFLQNMGPKKCNFKGVKGVLVIFLVKQNTVVVFKLRKPLFPPCWHVNISVLNSGHVNMRSVRCFVVGLREVQVKQQTAVYSPGCEIL